MKKKVGIFSAVASRPSWQVSAIPIIGLLACFGAIIFVCGPTAVADYAPWVMLGASAISVVMGTTLGCLSRRSLCVGLHRSAAQILPAIPMLICIAALASTWMLSGVVPVLINYGLQVLNPKLFLVTTCVVCATVSVLTGSSWSTIATIGVAFVGIGEAMGYSAGWTAGAIISGAYFGDKISPLSDTTVLASSACSVKLFTHIRAMMITTVPAMVISLIIFGMKGFMSEPAATASSAAEIRNGLAEIFNLSPWVLLVPAITFSLIALKAKTLIVLTVSAGAGAIAAAIFQPHLASSALSLASTTISGVSIAANSEIVGQLTSTSGILGILPVVFLVISAMLFGTAMISTGMLQTLTEKLTGRLRGRTPIVASTIGSGLVLNAATADQYLSIIIAANIYRQKYSKAGLQPKLLSRTLEDSISATSPLIPWSSCGVTQSTVLGVAVIEYLPYCIFNYLTPLVSLSIVALGYKIKFFSLKTAFSK